MGRRVKSVRLSLEDTTTRLDKNITLIVRSTCGNDGSLGLRALRFTTPVRKGGHPEAVCEFAREYIGLGHPGWGVIEKILLQLQETYSLEGDEGGMEVVEEPAGGIGGGGALISEENSSNRTKEEGGGKRGGGGSVSQKAAGWKEKVALVAPELEAYMSLVVLGMALRSGSKVDAVFQVKLAEIVLNRVMTYNRRSLDLLLSRILSYYSLAYERQGRQKETRPTLMALLRTCCLHHDEMGQATALNLLLRNLLHDNLLDQAYKLSSKTSFPGHASNNQFCRYLYYMGRIHALQLDYSDAQANLAQSTRKLPQNTGLGFRRACSKLSIIVQLLLGEIPERSVFNQRGLQASLAPYLQLTQAVRLGNLEEFNRIVLAQRAVFQADKTHTLIQRLSHNVVKTGLRKINLAYSRISINDLCEKVCLDSAGTTEFVCAKAIRDGVIDARISHEGGWVYNTNLSDFYSTDEPQQAINKRISFCLDVHNEAVRAMRYKERDYKELRKHEETLDDLNDEEFACEMEEGSDDE